MTRLHVVLPNDIDDPATPSGGNRYDRRVLDGLAAAGWSIREHPVYGTWPQPTRDEREQLARVLGGFPDGALVLIDGLVASAAPAELAGHTERLRQVLLVHMPLVTEAEHAALRTARALITTSAFTRRRLVELYGLDAHVATPGVDAAEPAGGSPPGRQLICVAAVTPHKGYDVLVEALAKVSDVPWTSSTETGALGVHLLVSNHIAPARLTMAATSSA